IGPAGVQKTRAADGERYFGGERPASPGVINPDGTLSADRHREAIRGECDLRRVRKIHWKGRGTRLPLPKQRWTATFENASQRCAIRIEFNIPNALFNFQFG